MPRMAFLFLYDERLPYFFVAKRGLESYVVLAS